MAMLRNVLIASLFFLLAFVGTWFLSRESEDISTGSGLPVDHWMLQEPCVLQQEPCTATADDNSGSITFSITPNSIPLLKELTITVTTTGIANVSHAKVIVEGVNMFMGYQKAELQRINDNTLQGHLTLPICSNTHMEWQASLNLTTSAHEITAVFPFETNR